MNLIGIAKPKLLDLFCGAGGCSGPKDGSAGYSRYFDCTGVDIANQPRYPHRFVRADALEYLEKHHHEFDFFAASPPCKKFTMMMTIRTDTDEQRAKHLDLIAPTRELLKVIGKPYIIENTVPSILNNPVMLCGTMFGLGVLRHRYFESNVCLAVPEHPPHHGSVQDGTYCGVYGTGGAMMRDDGQGRRMGSRKVADWRAAMGIDWMTKAEITQAIPPAFTSWLGIQLMEAKQQLSLFEINA